MMLCRLVTRPEQSPQVFRCDCNSALPPSSMKSGNSRWNSEQFILLSPSLSVPPALPFPTAIRPFRLCSSSGTRATSFLPCATATCCCRSSNPPWLRSHCARTLPHRGAQKSNGIQVAVGRLHSAIATDLPNPTGQDHLPQNLSSACRRRLRSPLRAILLADPSSASASAQRSLPCDAARSRTPTHHGTFRSCGTTAGTLLALDPRLRRYSPSSASTENIRDAYAGYRETRTLPRHPAWLAQLPVLPPTPAVVVARSSRLSRPHVLRCG